MPAVADVVPFDHVVRETTSGRPRPDVRMHVYDRGTVDEVQLYAIDGATLRELDQPILSDTYGRFPNVWHVPGRYDRFSPDDTAGQVQPYEAASALEGDASAIAALNVHKEDPAAHTGELQPLDSDLSAIAALTSAANKLPYATGAGAWALADLSAFGRSLVDDADAAAARSTLSAPPRPTTGTHAARLASSPTTGQLWKETDTGLIYLYDGSSWVVWKGQGQVSKTADETVNNSATLQNDDHLFFPIEASERWFVKAWLFAQGASVNADWKFGWTGPAGASASWGAIAPRGEAITGGTWAAAAATSTPQAALAIGTPVAAAGANAIVPIMLAGMFLAAGTAGTIQFQWAQNSTIAEDSKLLTGSFLELVRLA